MSVPIEPTGSWLSATIGSIKSFRSSCVYPKACCKFNLSRFLLLLFLLSFFTKSNKLILLFFTIFSYGSFVERSSFISSSVMILPFSRSISSMRPGCNRHFSFILFSGYGRTPVSDDKTILPSFVVKYLAGLSPFLSKVAPICLPSVNAIAAGPSQGSIKPE